MSLNYTKSEVMIITNKNSINPSQIFIANNPVKYINNFKYLGMNIDSKLKSYNQISQVKGKLSRMCDVS